MLVIAELDQRQPEGRTGDQLERLLRRRPQFQIERIIPLLPFEAGQIVLDPAEHRLIAHQLMRNPVDLLEPRPQALVTGHHT
ncbi:hypothetical protein D3C87_2033140 [compost metagenome]